MSAAPGIYLQALPIELSLGYAERAEASGFASVWLSEITFGDVVTPAAAVAARTERIGIGTGIVGLWSRTPATTALTAASLQQLSQVDSCSGSACSHAPTSRAGTAAHTASRWGRCAST